MMHSHSWVLDDIFCEPWLSNHEIFQDDPKHRDEGGKESHDHNAKSVQYTAKYDGNFSSL